MAVVNNSVRFFDYWFVDLRDFTFFFGPSFFDTNPKMNIKTISLNQLGTAFFSEKYIKSKWYGYYQLDFSQAEE